MPATIPLETVVLTGEATIARRFQQIESGPDHPWNLRVAEVESAVVEVQVVFVHVSVPDFLGALRRLADRGCAVIALVNRGDVPTSVAAMQMGAVDCVEWGRVQVDELPWRAWQSYGLAPHHRSRRNRESAIPDSDRELVKRNRQLAGLHEYAQELAALPFSKDMFGTAVRKMKEITGSVAVAMSTYDPESRSLVVRHASLSSHDRSMVVRMIGKRLEGMRLKVPPGMHDQIVRKAVTDLGSLSETTFGAVLPSLSAQVERALGVRWFKAVSFQDDGQLLGTIVLAGGRESERPSDDDISAYAGVTTNALKRWLAEQAARGAESRYRLMAENAHDVFWQATPDVVFTYVSPSATRMLGYPIDQLEGRSIMELVPPGSARVIRDGLGRRMKEIEAGTGGASEPVEIEMVRSDGSRIWVEVLAAPTLGPRGELLGFTGVTRDITQRRQAEEALRRSEALFRAFMDQSADGFCIIDEQGLVVEWSKGLEHLTCVRRGEAIGRSATDVIARPGQGDDGQWISDSMPGLISGQSGHRGIHRECSWIDADGKMRFVRCSLFPVAVENRHRLGLAMYDITAVRAAESERRDMELALQQSAKREAMGRLAGGVAHDFNNLLTAIAANLELAIEAVREGTVPERPLLQAALDSTHTAASVTRQLLAFSKRQVVEASPVDLDELVRGLETMLGRMVGEHIQIRMELSADRRRILADSVQFEQIIVNLVLNAAEAMPGGGQVLVLTRVFVAADGYHAANAHPHAPAKPVKPGEYAVLEVADTGRGMSDEVKRHLFEPFYTTKRSGHHGTGLGLAAMHGVVEQAGGFVEVASELGNGSRIRICWPVLTAAPAPAVKKSGLRARLPVGNETIMFVEDEETIRAVACRVLERTGYRVLAASSGEEALEKGKAHPEPIHLLVTDVVMPGMNGRVLAERWAEQHPESAVLLTSGHTEDTVVQQGVVAGEVAFLGKPYTVDALAKRVRSLLDADKSRACQ